MANEYERAELQRLINQIDVFEQSPGYTQYAAFELAGKLRKQIVDLRDHLGGPVEEQK